MHRTLRAMAFGPLAAIALAAPALAQDEERESTGPFDVELGLTIASDYRFRGISLNDKDVAFQPEITVSHESGLYGTVWGSNIAENPGDDVEVDVTLGYAKDIGDVSVDIGAVYYLYPGFSSANYIDLLGSLSTQVGPAKVGVNVAYAPKQDNIGGVDNLYWGASAEVGIPDTPLTFAGSIGVEDGAFGNNKVDWSLGVSADIKGFTLGVAYIDTARTGGDPLGKATAVVSLSAAF